jgi:hypothetical protein
VLPAGALAGLLAALVGPIGLRRLFGGGQPERGDLQTDGAYSTFELIGDIQPDGQVTGSAGLYRSKDLE